MNGKLLIHLLLLSACALTVPSVVLAQGIALTGVGAINRSFGGAAVASPIDAAGALHWNPAAISGLPKSQVAVSLELLQPNTELSSSIDALSADGSTSSDAGISTIPVLALVLRDADSPWTFGVGVFGVAGFGVDYPEDQSNPLLASAEAGGFGAIIGEAEIVQTVPTVSYQWGNVALGIAPVLTIARLQADPFFFAQPNANGTYLSGTDPEYAFGGGFQTGVFYRSASGLQLGASYKSPQWMENVAFDSEDESGHSRGAEFSLDYPQIASVGIGYTGLDDWTFGADIRHFAYSHADGFKQQGFDEQGAVRGLGWDSIFAGAFGVQYKVSDSTSLRMGYTYCESPIRNHESLFNVLSPLITQHQLGGGVSIEIAEQLTLSITYLHLFKNSVNGPLEIPQSGPLEGTSVRNEVSADSIGVGLTLAFDRQATPAN